MLVKSPLKNKNILKIINIIGLDGAILYTSFSKVFTILSSVVTIFIITKFLSATEQGFYYTFSSVLAIQLFFELGLNSVITQYTAHEVSFLTWESNAVLKGSTSHISRLSSLLHFAMKWYLLLSSILFVALFLVGFYFFTEFDNTNGSVSWFFPWLVISISSTMSFIISPIAAFLEGLGKVKQIAKIRFITQLCSMLIIWLSLSTGFKLYAGGLSTLIGVFVFIVILYYSSHFNILINIWKLIGKEKVDFFTEIFPFQWKIAISVISGYFIFQLFSPVLFATEGPIIAGQMGQTQAALNGILGLSFSWMSTKIPLFSNLVARKKYKELDAIFNRTLIQSSIINASSLILLLVFIFGLRHYQVPLGSRFLSYGPLILMMIPIFLNQISSSWSTYLRCHKKDPFLVLSIIGAITTSVSTIYLGKFYGVIGITMGYCLLFFFINFLGGYYIFRSKKRAWHLTS